MHRVLDETGLELLRTEVKDEIDDAITSAWEAPDPEPSSALRHVFAEDEPS